MNGKPIYGTLNKSLQKDGIWNAQEKFPKTNGIGITRGAGWGFVTGEKIKLSKSRHAEKYGGVRRGLYGQMVFGSLGTLK